MVEILHIDLCSGIGGFSLAASWLGWRTVAHSEVEQYCCRVYHRHFPDSECLGDVRKVDWHEFKKKTEGARIVVTAGFPCQPSSCAGRRQGEEDERDLWGECARAVRELRPDYALFENVPGVLTVNSGRYFNRIVSDLAACGYDVEWQIVSAKDVGAPHLRKRIWIVAYPVLERRQQITRGAYGDEGEDEGRAATQADESAGGCERSRARTLAHADGGGRGGRKDDEGEGQAERGRAKTGCQVLAHAAILRQRPEQEHAGPHVPRHCGTTGDGQTCGEGEGKESDGIMANTECDGRQQGPQDVRRRQSEPAICSEDICNAEADGCGQGEQRRSTRAGKGQAEQAFCHAAIQGLPDWAGGEVEQPWPLTKFERSDGISMADPESKREVSAQQQGQRYCAEQGGTNGGEREIELYVRHVSDGLPSGMAPGAWRYTVRVKNRVSKLRALGNSIVPQCAFIPMSLIDAAIRNK